MTMSAYQKWLADYTANLSSKDLIERKEEERLDYRHPSQAYPDYLDYVEEWEWSAEQQANQLLSTVILSFSKAKRMVACKCGVSHQMSIVNQKGFVSMKDADAASSCWYLTIRESVHNVLNSLRRNQTRLPSVIESMMSRIMTWQMVGINQTPTLLPFEVFKEIWWTVEEEDRFSIGQNFLRELKYSDQDMIRIQKNIRKPEPTETKDILLHFPHEQHGMHSLLTALGDSEFSVVLSWINKNRRKLGSRERISMRMVRERMFNCEFCRNTSSAGLTTAGIYYAPPGMGKTTAMNRELFIGLDTDWLGVGLTWMDYRLILKKRIPILTNQKHLFRECGYRVVGMYSDHIRLMPNGEPYTTVSEIRKEVGTMGNDAWIYYAPKKYMTDEILKLEIYVILQRMVANYAINLLPFYENEKTAEWTLTFPKLNRREAYAGAIAPFEPRIHMV